jgi:hypothetical protein
MKEAEEEEESLPAEPLKDSPASANSVVSPESNPARLQKLSGLLSSVRLLLGAIEGCTTINSFEHRSSCGSAVKWLCFMQFMQSCSSMLTMRTALMIGV